MSSLPALGPVLQARHVPINRARLERRLTQLAPHHRAELNALARLLAWSRLPLLEADSALVRRARTFVPTLSSSALADIARDRLEMRTLIAALRHRHAGAERAPEGRDWGYGRFLSKIAANWREPNFGVERAFPFIRPAREALEKGDVQRVERIFLETAWNQVDRVAASHVFDYDAVAFYVIRWHLLERWTRYDAEAATRRFNTMVGHALADASDRLTGLSLEETSL